MDEALEPVDVDRFQPLTGTIQLAEALGGCSIDIEIPLEPFDGEEGGAAVETSFRLENILLPVKDIEELDGFEFAVPKEDSDGSIYLGNAHNPVDIPSIRFERSGPTTFLVHAELHCDFEYESVGQSATVPVKVELELLSATPL